MDDSLRYIKKFFLFQIGLYAILTFLVGCINGIVELSLLAIFPILILLGSYFLLGAVGLFFSVKYFKNTRGSFFRIPLLVTSISLLTILPALLVGTPILNIGQSIGNLGRPKLINTINQKVENSQMQDYQYFQGLLKKEFVAKDVDGQLILTTDGFVFKLINFYPKGNFEEFNKYAKSLLLNQVVTIKLPSESEFLEGYAGHSGVFYERKNHMYYDIPTFVYLNNEELNSKFSNENY